LLIPKKELTLSITEKFYRMKQQSDSNLRLGMTFMASIFFVFGFITNFNIAMKDQVKVAFDLHALYPGWENFLAQLVNGVFFLAYACFSFLCGTIIKKIGYKNGVITGLALVALGSYMFFPAVAVLSYPLFLLAVFVMATGVVFLQTAANPYVAALGPQETAPARLNFTQALNSVATTIAPFLAGILVLAPAVLAINNGATMAEAAKYVQMPFIIIGSVVVLIAIGISFIKLPVIKGDETIPSTSVLRKPQVWLGALGIFFYVGAEVGTAGQIAPYLIADGSAAIDVAVKLSAIYWGGAMIGRFYGSILLGTLPAAKKYQYSIYVMIFAFFVGWFITSASVNNGQFVFDSKPLNGFIFLGIAVANFFLMMLGKGKANVALGIFGTVNMLLVLAAIMLPATIGMWCLLSIGFFNSIMFPNIFALGVSDLDASEMPLASGIINTLIVGGAIIPLLLGAFTDAFSARGAMFLLVFSYAYITFFALKGSKIR
jgi:FHS family L-fucose permease-like MFS transporter